MLLRSFVDGALSLTPTELAQHLQHVIKELETFRDNCKTTDTHCLVHTGEEVLEVLEAMHADSELSALRHAPAYRDVREALLGAEVAASHACLCPVLEPPEKPTPKPSDRDSPRASQAFSQLADRWARALNDADRHFIMRIACSLGEMCYEPAAREAFTVFSDLATVTLRARLLAPAAPSQQLAEATATLVLCWKTLANPNAKEKTETAARNSLAYRCHWLSELLYLYRLAQPELVGDWARCLDYLRATFPSRYESSFTKADNYHAAWYAKSPAKEKQILVSLRMLRLQLRGDQIDRSHPRVRPKETVDWSVGVKGHEPMTSARVLDIDAATRRHVKVALSTPLPSLISSTPLLTFPNYGEYPQSSDPVDALFVRACTPADNLFPHSSGIVLELNPQWVVDTESWNEWVTQQMVAP